MAYSIHANPYILRYVSKDYADNTPEGNIMIDCSLGVNADLLGNCIFQRLHAFEQALLGQTSVNPETDNAPE